jgi:hypothetical protein
MVKIAIESSGESETSSSSSEEEVDTPQEIAGPKTPTQTRRRIEVEGTTVKKSLVDSAPPSTGGLNPGMERSEVTYYSGPQYSVLSILEEVMTLGAGITDKSKMILTREDFRQRGVEGQCGEKGEGVSSQGDCQSGFAS